MVMLELSLEITQLATTHKVAWEYSWVRRRPNWPLVGSAQQNHDSVKPGTLICLKAKASDK